MDAFKQGEVARMALGGNAPWKEFFNAHSSNTLLGRDFDSCTIAERYDSEAGEEWKERLTAKVEEREYVPGAKPAVVKKAATPAMSSAGGSGRSTPQGTAPQRIASPSQKARNEAYFASKGQENENRPEGVAPSQGGKYAGFGSSPMPTSNNNSGGVPTANDFQNDPVAALTRGFGWLSSTVTKQAATVNKTYIQPGLSNLAQADLAAQARATAAQLGTTVQQGTRGLNDQFQKFVDPDAAPAAGGISRGGKEPAKKDFWDSFGEAPAGPSREKKDFWDDFAAVGEQVQQKKSAGSSSIGTSAMKPGAGAGGKKDEDDGWGKW